MLCLRARPDDLGDAELKVRVAACELGHAGNRGRAADILEDMIRRALERAGCFAAEIDYVVSGLGERCESEPGPERQVLERMFANGAAVHVPMRYVAGECFSANAALQLAAACVLLEQAGAGRTALVTGMSDQGNLGCAVLHTGRKSKTHD
jgi:acetyl-CoA acetyltransferase